MEHSKVNNQWINLVVILTIILNTFGAPLSRLTHIPSIVFTGIPVVLLGGIAYFITNGKMVVKKEIRVYLCIICLTLLIHTLKSVFKPEIGFGDYELKYVIYFFIFILGTVVLGEENFKAVEISFIGISLFLSVDAIMHVREITSQGLGIYNVMNVTLLDKSYYTCMLSLSVVFLVVDFFSERKNLTIIKKSLIFCCIILFTAVDLIIAQSKLFLMVLATTGLFLIIFSKGSQRKKVIWALLLAIFAVILVFSVRPDWIPEYVYIFLYRTFGLFEDVISNMPRYHRMTSTYRTRNVIYEYAFQLFFENPLVGIGFGNYKVYAAENVALGGVFQTESSYLGILVEGGLFYATVHFAFLFKLFINTVKGVKKCAQSDIFYKLLFGITGYIVLNSGNDFYNSTYWLILAFVYNITTTRLKREKACVINRKGIGDRTNETVIYSGRFQVETGYRR